MVLLETTASGSVNKCKVWGLSRSYWVQISKIIIKIGRRLQEVRLPKARFWKNIVIKTNRKRAATTIITITIGLVTRRA